MTLDEIQSALALIQGTSEIDMTRTLDSAIHQLSQLESEYREGQQRLVRIANMARRSIHAYQKKKARYLDEELPYLRQEIALLGTRESGANVRHLLSRKMIEVNNDVIALDKKMAYRLRQVRIEARALVQYGAKIELVETAFRLISTAIEIRAQIVALGMDPHNMSTDDVRRIETLLLKG